MSGLEIAIVAVAVIAVFSLGLSRGQPNNHLKKTRHHSWMMGDIESGGSGFGSFGDSDGGGGGGCGGD